MSVIKVFKDIDELLTMKGAYDKSGRGVVEQDLSEIKNGAMIVLKDKILWCGKTSQLGQKKVSSLLEGHSVKELSLKGRTVMPGFVESHTHTIFAGDRSDEFEQRNQGVSYQEIAKEGGGILSTVRSTRKASAGSLLAEAEKRVDRFIKQGVTTLEIKSGYALDLKGESKMLKVARDLNKIRTVVTYLGPHSIPEEFSCSETYMDYILKEVLPVIAKKNLADRVDIFVEENYFSCEQARVYLNASQKLGFKATIHADQLTNNHGAMLGVELGCDSVDHLVQINQREIARLAKSDTTAVLLPGADLYLKMNYPKARDLIEKGARIALATDFNPGSCPTQSLSLVGVLARLEMKMSLPEVLSAYTIGAASALGLSNEIGALIEGQSADFITLDSSWRHLFYDVGYHPVCAVWSKGKKVRY